MNEDQRPEGFRRVASRLEALGHREAPLWLDVAARTSQEAADVLGIAVGQIAKSIVFRGARGDAVLVVASGDRRVDEAKLAALVGPLARADAAFVKERTGFAIGGVAPVGHLQPPVMLIDRELCRYDEVWAAAGHPNGVFAVRPQELTRLTGAPIADVAQGDPTPGLAAPSPCNDVCRIDAAVGRCPGCTRTLDEIAAWSTLDDDARWALWERIAVRRLSSAAKGSR
jgi:prolyl-tRNA editing enzyme YbaK/EbsC (Cys-tRNA(Pro) deacylase)/predicted Fe-S protein YdhL (DUF1289 family)